MFLLVIVLPAGPIGVNLTPRSEYNCCKGRKLFLTTAITFWPSDLNNFETNLGEAAGDIFVQLIALC